MGVTCSFVLVLLLEPPNRMKTESLHIGMKVRHANHGAGVVVAIAPQSATVRFDSGEHTVSPEASGLEPAEAQAQLTGLTVSLAQIIRETVEAVAAKLAIEQPGAVVEQLGPRWRGGKFVLHPADATLATKEVPLEVFFHKIVMMRNQLRVMEQKLNAHPQLADADKVDLQQHLTKCYGSMTTFNLLFKEKTDQF